MKFFIKPPRHPIVKVTVAPSVFQSLIDAPWSVCDSLKRMERAERFFLFGTEDLEIVRIAHESMDLFVRHQVNMARARSDFLTKLSTAYDLAGLIDVVEAAFDNSAEFYSGIVSGSAQLKTSHDPAVMEMFPSFEYHSEGCKHPICRQLNGKVVGKMSRKGRLYYPPWHCYCPAMVFDTDRKPTNAVRALPEHPPEYFFNPIDYRVAHGRMENFHGSD